MIFPTENKVNLLSCVRTSQKRKVQTSQTHDTSCVFRVLLCLSSDLYLAAKQWWYVFINEHSSYSFFFFSLLTTNEQQNQFKMFVFSNRLSSAHIRFMHVYFSVSMLSARLDRIYIHFRHMQCMFEILKLRVNNRKTAFSSSSSMLESQLREKIVQEMEKKITNPE